MSDEQIERQKTLGALGGSQNTDAQRQARSKGPAAASVVRSAEAVGRTATIRSLRSSGYKITDIMARLGVSKSTVMRALRDNG